MGTTAVYCFLLSSIVFISSRRFILLSDSLIDSFGSHVSSFSLSFSLFDCYSFFVYTLLHSVLSYRICHKLIPVLDICVWDSSLVHCSIYMVGFRYFRYFRYICLLVSPRMFPFFVLVRVSLSAVPSS